MNKIGFKNFRRFQIFPPVSIGGVTYLVGGNNSGKSTVVKGTLLMMNFLSTTVEGFNSDNIFKRDPAFSFDVVSPFDVHIGTFKRALYNRFESPEIRFDLGIDDFYFSIVVSGNPESDSDTSADVKSIVIDDHKNLIKYSVDYSRRTMTIDFYGSNKNEYSISKRVVENNTWRRREIESKISQSTDFSEIVGLKEELRQLNIFVHRPDNQNFELSHIELELCQFLNSPSEKLFISIIKNFIEYAGTSISSDVPEDSQFYLSEKQKKQHLQWKSSEIEDSMARLELSLYKNNVEYIYAHAAKQVVFFNSKDKNDYMAQTIHLYESNKVSNYSKSQDFLTKWIPYLEIGDDIEIVGHGGEAYEIKVIEDGLSTDLADKGMGSIQIMILLLRLATYIKKYNGSSLTVMVEEPEQNLHPKIQSLLAELFEYIYTEYGFQVIVETHSEYLIRHLQVLTALHKYSDDEFQEKNSSTVLYFPDAKSQKYPYDMGLKSNGKFTEDFGTGFFNVSDDSAMKLFDLEEM